MDSGTEMLVGTGLSTAVAATASSSNFLGILAAAFTLEPVLIAACLLLLIAGLRARR